MHLIRRIIEYVRMHGLGYTACRAMQMLRERLCGSYDRAFRCECCSDAELAIQRASQPDAGLISVAVPLYNTRPAFLNELVGSLMAQSYENWEAVLLDGGSTDAEALAAMDALPADPRIRLVHETDNAGISGNTNRAIALCRGDYLALCDHDDLLTPDALWHVAQAIIREQPDMIYSDEDKATEDGCRFQDPHRKPDFCPDNLRSGNYICHLMVIRRSVLERLGGLRSGFDGSQDHDLTLRISEVTDRICHIPRVLYHWRTVKNSVSHQHMERCMDAAARAVEEHMARIGYPGTCRPEAGVLRLRYSVEEDASVRVIVTEGRTRYAQMNRAAAAAVEPLLLFVDASAQLPDDDAIREMKMYAQRDDVGAVTPMLINRHGRVTHAGFALLESRIVSRGRGLPWHAGGWHGLNRTSCNVAAVSAGCIMIRRDHFVPFDEGYTGGCGAVEWCLRLRKNGLRHVMTPHARIRCEDRELLAPVNELAKLLQTCREYWRDDCATGPHAS